MLDKGRLLAILAVTVAVAVFSLVWSAALYVMLGFSIGAVRPWSVYQYLYLYGISDANVLTTAFLIAAMAAALGAGALWVLRPKHYYGDARWAHGGEIRRARLLDAGGVLLGKRGGTYLRNDEPAHVLVAAPTRSGKGVGIVVPNLLSWPGSVVVLDIKHENHTLTSGFRGAHQRVFKWSPMDDERRSHGYNPLDEVRGDIGHRVSDLQRLAVILLPGAPHSDSMWQNEARDLFIGLTLFVMDDKTVPSTIGEVYRTLKANVDLAELAGHVIKTHSESLDATCTMSLSNFMHKAPKERSGVKSNLTAALNLWANPVIDAATAASDFRLSELRKRPTSIYVGVKQNQLLTMAPLIRLFFQQCVDALGRDLPGSDEPHQVLMMIDEFAALGRMGVIENALAFLAGYNIRLVLIVQGLGQLEELYGKGAESLLQNAAVQVYFAPNDDTTAMYVSKRLGTKTIAIRSKSDPGGFQLSTKSTASAARAFMLPEEIRQLRSTKEIVFKENARPVQAQKIVYYRDKTFTSRLLPALAVPELSLAPMQPRVFELPEAPPPAAAAMPSKNAADGQSGAEPKTQADTAQQEASGFDEDGQDEAQRDEYLASGEQLAKLVEEESSESAHELRAALDNLSHHKKTRTTH